MKLLYSSFAPYVLIIALAQGQTLLPIPKGPFISGVIDFEFTDTTYPSDLPADAKGRRIMVRAWYPACHRSDFSYDTSTCGSSKATLGPKRRYFEEGEREAIAQPEAEALGVFFDFGPLFDALNTTDTHSYMKAPALSKDKSGFPILIFNHGAIGYVSQNTALMEELASQGYAVFSVTHPGGSSGIMYPTGDTIHYDEDFLTAGLQTANFDPNGLNSPDIGVRYEAKRRVLQEGQGLVSYLQRWRDDMIALVDHLEEISFAESPAKLSKSSSAEETVLYDVVKDGIPAVFYFGMSYGGAAATAAAHVDERAVAAINLDGMHWGANVFGKAIRTPNLTFVTEPVELGFGYSNEFFFEPLETMGTDPRVTRIHLFNLSHFELTDFAFVPAEDRLKMPRSGAIDGNHLHEILVSYCLGFISSSFVGDTWSPDTTLHKFPDTRLLDVSYVSDWKISVAESPAMVATDAASSITPGSNPPDVNPDESSASLQISLMWAWLLTMPTYVSQITWLVNLSMKW